VQPDISTPAVISWSLRIEQEISPRTALTVAYVGSHSYHQILSEDMNEPVPLYTADGQPYYTAGAPYANPELANTSSWVSQGVGLYNSFQADVRRTFANSVQFRGNYTWSKNLDDGSTWNTSVSANTPAFVSFPLNPKMDWGPSAIDVRHAASINASWDLPFGPKRRYLNQGPALLQYVVRDWTASAIVALQSGFPFSPQLGYNPTGNGDNRNPVRPNWNSAFSGKLYPHTPDQWFNPAAFSKPATGTFGNVRRDSLYGPGLTNLDFSAARSAHIEGVNLQFRAEFFNILNHSNFLTPNPVVYSSATSDISPTAGVISSTSTTSRQIQFGLKLSF
jgi:hypothetical protein